MGSINQNTSSPKVMAQDSIILDLKDLDLSDIEAIKGTALGMILEKADRDNITAGHTQHTSHSSHSAHYSSMWV